MNLSLVRIGNNTLHNVIVATTPWQRLRGWYGYQALPVNAVLLTRCNAVQTLALSLRLDLLWLNHDRRCIQVQPSLSAWRFAWCRGASHVLELREGVLDEVTPTIELIGRTIDWVPGGR